jgi:hypothetical protein
MQAVCYDYQGDSYALHMNQMAEYLLHHDYYTVQNGVATALSATLADDWLAADLEEVRSLVLEHMVWQILAPLIIVNALGMKWVRTTKSSGRKKSRLVGQGYNMIFGVDYHETFAPVARMVTLRLLLTFVALYSLFTGSLDVKTAFLNAPIHEDVWLKPPKELLGLLKMLLKQTKGKAQRKILKEQIKGLEAGYLLKLLKALYGTKQAGREWYLMVNDFLISMGFKPNQADPCFYSQSFGEDYVLVLLYVDDIIIAATTEALKMKYVSLFRKQFKISYSGELTEYLNIKIFHDRVLRTVTLSQQHYIEKMMVDFKIMPGSVVTTPM